MTDANGEWHLVCAAAEIDQEDVIRFDHGDRTFAVYNTLTGFFATDGVCTHEGADLTDGLVIGDIIECPLHQGRFHIPSGKAKSPPVCIDLRTHPVRVEGGEVFIQVPAAD